MLKRTWRKPRLALSAAAAAISLCGLLGWWFRLDTYHLVTVHEGVLYRDGNRGMREFTAAVRTARPKTVICLVDDDELRGQEYVDEQEFLGRAGIAFVRIPIVKGDWPTTAQIRQFLSITTDPARQPVLFHDNEGIRRAGMMMAAYQESVLGYDDARAKAAIRGFGHSERTIRDVETFILAYDGPRRELDARTIGKAVPATGRDPDRVRDGRGAER
jgi:protein tyrosine phosphatase (PTP) superfamily phosphohydrolase (DUF442 family)